MTKKQIERLVQTELARRRAVSATIAADNYRKACENDKFLKIEEKIRNLEFEIAKNNAFEKDTLVQNNELKKVQEKRIEIARHERIDINSFEPVPVCKECSDKGIINGKPCKCFQKMVSDLLLKQSGLSGKPLHHFSEFNERIAKTEKQQHSLNKVNEILKKLAEKFPNNNIKTITICGPTGTGKTFILECVASEVLKNGYSVLYLTAYEFGSLLLKFHTTFDHEKQSIMDTLLSPDLLVIDDFGTEPVLKNVTMPYTYLVLSERKTQEKTTLISTNLSISSIGERYGERIMSRLLEKKHSATILLEGEDLRFSKK